MIYLVLTKAIKDTLLLAFHPWHCSGLKNVESEMEIFHFWHSCRIVPLVVVDLVVLIEPPAWGPGKLLGEEEAKLELGV